MGPSIRLLERCREALPATAEAAVVERDRHRRRVWLAAHGILAADWHDLGAQVVGFRDGVERARAGPGVELGPRGRRDRGALAVVIGEAHLRADTDLELPAGFLADGAEVAVTRELEEDAVPGRECAVTVDFEERSAERGPGRPVASDFQHLHLSLGREQL